MTPPSNSAACATNFRHITEPVPATTPITVVYDGDAKVSLRSRGNINVAEIAANYGGGGHRDTVGFRMPLARFASDILGNQANKSI